MLIFVYPFFLVQILVYQILFIPSMVFNALETNHHAIFLRTVVSMVFEPVMYFA